MVTEGCDRITPITAKSAEISLSTSRTVRADEEGHIDRRLVAPVVPTVAGAVLHDRVAGTEHNLGTVVELEHDLPGEDVLEVDRVGRVHPRVVLLHVGREPGEPAFRLGPVRL